MERLCGNGGLVSNIPSYSGKPGTSVTWTGLVDLHIAKS